MMHVDLPNGISVEIRHSSASPEADGGLAAMNEMEKAMEELVDHFSSMGARRTSGSPRPIPQPANQRSPPMPASNAGRAGGADGGAWGEPGFLTICLIARLEAPRARSALHQHHALEPSLHRLHC